MIAVLSVPAILSAHASGAPTRPVDRNLDDYVVFAFNHLSFKGGTVGQTVISGGDVGAGGIDTTPGNSDTIMDVCANFNLKMDQGSQVNADTMRISNKCAVWDIFANHLTQGSNVAPENSGPTPFSTPLLSGMPSFPTFACDPNKPVSVEKNASATLPPVP